jgi:hypothetical protein
MPALPYTRGVPNPPNSPSSDVQSMQTNTNSAADIWQADHFAFAANDPGIHKQSRYETKVSSDVATTATQGAVYTKTINSVVELVYRQNSSATPIQLTGGSSLSGFIGYQFLPGGLILQWGFVFGSHDGGIKHTFAPGDTGTVTFPFVFPSRVFTVQTTMNYNTDTSGGNTPASGSSFIISLDYSVAGTTNASFDWRAAGSGGSYTVFYWTALGR